MVIYFKSEKALRHLLKNGIVYTLREQRRKRNGKDWITTQKGGSKIADVIIKEVAFVNMVNDSPYNDVKVITWDELNSYVRNSGFSSLSEWIAEYWTLHKKRGRIPTFAWLYEVKLEADSLANKK